jgi:hypothetical protein
MFKRVVWLGIGTGIGAAGSLWAERKVRRRMERYTPTGVAKQVTVASRRIRDDLALAAEEGRRGMREREAELRDGMVRPRR